MELPSYAASVRSSVALPVERLAGCDCADVSAIAVVGATACPRLTVSMRPATIAPPALRMETMLPPSWIAPMREVRPTYAALLAAIDATQGTLLSNLMFLICFVSR